MKSRIFIIGLLLSLLAYATAACATQPAGKELAGAAVGRPDVIPIMGAGVKKTTLSLAQLKDEQAKSITITIDDKQQDYVGLSIDAFMKYVSADPDAKTLVATSQDGEEYELSLESSDQLADVYVVFTDGSLSLVKDGDRFLIRNISSFRFKK